MGKRLDKMRWQDRVKDDVKKEIKRQSKEILPLNWNNENNSFDISECTNPFDTTKYTNSCEPKNQIVTMSWETIKKENKIPKYNVGTRLCIFLWLVKKYKLNIFQALYLTQIDIEEDSWYICKYGSSLRPSNPIQMQLISKSHLDYVKKQESLFQVYECRGENLPQIYNFIYNMRLNITKQELSKLYKKTYKKNNKNQNIDIHG